MVCHDWIAILVGWVSNGWRLISSSGYYASIIEYQHSIIISYDSVIDTLCSMVEYCHWMIECHACCIMHYASCIVLHPLPIPTVCNCLPVLVIRLSLFVTIRRYSTAIRIYSSVASWCIVVNHDASRSMIHWDALWRIIIHHDASWCWLGESRRCAKQYIYIYIYIWCIIHVYIYPGSLGLGALALLVPSHSDLRCPKVKARNVCHKIRAGASRAAESSPEVGPVSLNAYKNRSPKWALRH